MKALTPEEASEIAKGSYWDAVRADDLPAGLDYTVFDFGYNSGPAQASRSLQRVLGVAQDGVIGKQTLAAIGARPMRDLINSYCGERMRFLRGLKGPQGWTSNGRGWTNRVTGVRRNALAMTAGAAVVTAVYAGQGATLRDWDTLYGAWARCGDDCHRWRARWRWSGNRQRQG